MIGSTAVGRNMYPRPGGLLTVVAGAAADGSRALGFKASSSDDEQSLTLLLSDDDDDDDDNSNGKVNSPPASLASLPPRAQSRAREKAPGTVGPPCRFNISTFCAAINFSHFCDFRSLLRLLLSSFSNLPRLDDMSYSVPPRLFFRPSSTMCCAISVSHFLLIFEAHFSYPGPITFNSAFDRGWFGAHLIKYIPRCANLSAV